MLEQEFQYYLDHQDELVGKYNGKVIVIKGDEVIGVYDDETDAVIESQKKHELGSFLVQRCLPGSENHTITFHSRFAFA